jgi:hypothetical protein
MITRIRLFTHESIVHSQVIKIETMLGREVPFEIMLNQLQANSTIEFAASDREITLLKNDLGYSVFVFDGTRWLPHL